MEERLIVRDLATIALLLDHNRRMFLLPFRLAPHTVAAAARASQVQPNRMAYWVERFLQAGLLTSVGPSSSLAGTRRGQHYEMAAHELILLPEPGYAGEEVVEKLYGRHWRQLQEALSMHTDRRAAHWALRLFLHGNRVLVIDELPASALHPLASTSIQESTAVNLWLNVRLDQAALSDLQAELRDLALRYGERAARENSRVPRSLVHLALVRNYGDEE